MVEGNKSGDLPEPKDGITAEVLAELRADREKFVEETRQLLGEENKPLEEFVSFASKKLYKGEEFMDWSLAYYAILSRSAKTKGIPISEVSQDVVEKVGIEKKLRADGARARGVNKLWFLNESMENIGAFAEEDRGRSSELGTYWDNLFNFLADMATSNPQDRLPSIQLGVAIFDFADTIHIQHRINNGEQPFPQLN